MERPITDPSRRSVAIADDSDDSLYRRPGGGLPFRRPPATDSSTPDEVRAKRRSTDEEPAEPEHKPEPPFGPAPPATGGRTSFGFTAGPISGHWHDDEPEAPAEEPLPIRSYTGEHAATGITNHAASELSRPTRAPRPRPDEAPVSPRPRDLLDRTGTRDHLTRTGAITPGDGPHTGSHRRSDLLGDTGSPGRVSMTGGYRSPYDEPTDPFSFVEGGRRPAADEPTRANPRVPDPRPRFDEEHIGDLVGDSAHEIRPHTAKALRNEQQAHRPDQPQRHTRGVLVAGVALTAAVLLGGAVGGFAYFSSGDGGVTSVLELGAEETPQRTASVALEGREQAAFELVSAARKVTVRSADLGDTLFEATTGEESGILPQPTVTGERVQLNLAPTGAGDVGDVEIVLSSKVRWDLTFSGAAEEQILNLTGGRVEGLELSGGAKRTEIELPAATGTVPLRVSGAVDELMMRSPEGNPVRVKVKGGAQTVSAGARTLSDLEPGATLTPKDWATEDRYDVEAASPLVLLMVSSRER